MSTSAAADNGGGKLSIRFGDGAGGLGASTIYPVQGGDPVRTIATGRFNADSAPDLVCHLVFGHLHPLEQRERRVRLAGHRQ